MQNRGQSVGDPKLQGDLDSAGRNCQRDVLDDGMNLVICVKHIARGLWGKTVFATKEEAEAEIAERKVKQK